MKVNLTLIEKMVEAGATGSVILAYLRAQEDKQVKRRTADRERKRSGTVRKRAESERKPSETVSREATLTDTPRARLFREGKGALLTLGINANRAGALMAEWLKLTHDDEQLVLATILKAQELNVAEAPGWILETLRGRINGKRSNAGGRSSGGSDFFAGLAAVAQDIAGDGGVAGSTAPPVPSGRVNIDG